MNYLFRVLIFISIFAFVKTEYFDRFTGEKINETRIANQTLSSNFIRNCTVFIKPCTPHEGSRVNGTCNNYKHPARGAARGPYLRLRRPDYGADNDIRRGRNNEPLPSARKISTELFTTGRVVDKHMFTISTISMLQFIHRDVSHLNGRRDYLQRRQYCCDAPGATDRRCIPINVPDDDPYLRVTDIRCLNFSRAETFQDDDCAPNTVPAEQVNMQTPLLDLSTVYGVDEAALNSVRTYKDGMLKLERREDRYVPGANASQEICFTNRFNSSIPRNGSICYEFGFPEVGNFDLRTTTITIFFMREHNRLAHLLRHINPCWKDDRLFKVARRINIATASNIYLYELLPLLLGYKNMVDYGLISELVAHVGEYEEDAEPLVYAEFEIAVRYFHTLLDGRIKRYSEDYYYVGEFSYSDTLYKSSIIEQGTNFEEINRGTFYQNAAKYDDIEDPDISQKYYGEIQRAHDLIAIDIQRSRDMGIHGYNDYRHLCGLKPAKNFEDFLDVMDIEKIEILKKIYKEIEDVDLYAGLVSEKLVKGGYVGPTTFCIISKQLQLFRYSDRFWFERGDQLHSFSLQQLHEIRKTSMARFACDNAEAIKFIQPEAFVNIREGNAPVPCTYIPGPDLTKWRDDSCYKHEHSVHGKDKDKSDTKSNIKHGLQNHIDYSTFFDSFLSYDH